MIYGIAMVTGRKKSSSSASFSNYIEVGLKSNGKKNRISTVILKNKCSFSFI